MLIGYARVSTDDQDTAAQVAALTAAGCERIFHEKASGGRWNRPELLQLLTHLRHGDVVVVWKLDRLSRSLRDVLTLMAQLGNAGAGLPERDRGDRHDDAGRPDADAHGGGLRGVRARHAAGTHPGRRRGRRQEGRVGGRRPKLSPQQQAAIRKMVFGRREDGRRRRTPLQGPPRHRLASARADFDPQDPCHIICKGSCQEDA